jgi:hypothetical protein
MQGNSEENAEENRIEKTLMRREKQKNESKVKQVGNRNDEQVKMKGNGNCSKIFVKKKYYFMTRQTWAGASIW